MATRNGTEVDFIVSTQSDTLAIEVKSTYKLTEHDFSGLKLLAEENLPGLRRIVVNSKTDGFRRNDGIIVHSVDEFLSELWNGRLF